MLMITLEGTKGEVIHAIELLRNQTFKDNCSVLEKSWEEDDQWLGLGMEVKVEVELYLEQRDMYLYQVGQNHGLDLDLTPAPKTKEERDFGGWQEGESLYLRDAIERRFNENIHEPDGNIFRCKDGVFVTKGGILLETKISKNSNLPLSVE